MATIAKEPDAYLIAVFKDHRQPKVLVQYVHQSRKVGKEGGSEGRREGGYDREQGGTKNERK